LSGIGPALAKQIIEARPFRSVHELAPVKGIGAKRPEELRAPVKVE